MPIYEYQGQQYDIATEDPAAAKAKILKYIGTQGEAKSVDKPQAKDAGFSFGDLAKSFGMGAIGSTKALTDVAGAGNVASEKLDETTKSIQKSMTPERQAELKRQAARMKAAEESGSMLQEMKAGALNVIEAPLQSTAQALGSFVPYLPTLFAAPARCKAMFCASLSWPPCAPSGIDSLTTASLTRRPIFLAALLRPDLVKNSSTPFEPATKPRPPPRAICSKLGPK